MPARHPGTDAVDRDPRPRALASATHAPTAEPEAQNPPDEADEARESGARRPTGIESAGRIALRRQDVDVDVTQLAREFGRLLQGAMGLPIVRATRDRRALAPRGERRGGKPEAAPGGSCSSTGLITEEQLQRRSRSTATRPKSLGRVLIDLGYIRGGRTSSGRWPSRSGLSSSTSTEYPDRCNVDRPVARGAARAGTGDPDRERDGQAPGRDVGSGERLRARRHPHDHGPRRPTGRRDGERRRAGDPEVLRHGLSRSRRWRRSAAERRRRRPVTVEAALEDAPIVKLVQRDHDAGGGRPSLGRPHRAGRARRRGSGSASTACCTRSMHSRRRTSRAG